MFGPHFISPVQIGSCFYDTIPLPDYPPGTSLNPLSYAFSFSREKILSRIGYLGKEAYKFLVEEIREDTHSSFQGHL